MADGWLDSGTRIPFTGIVAIVVIVAVVAIFIKTQLAPLFPEPQITVEDENSLTGRATSDSFYGMREVDLYRHERLSGSLNRGDDAIDFRIDVANRELTINHGGSEEQILLEQQEEFLAAEFEYENLKTLVVINAPERTMRISTERSIPVTVSLSDEVVYTGSFKYRSATREVIFSPSAAVLQIDAAQIPLSENDATYAGTWDDDRQSKPVVIDMRKQMLTIEEIY